jgi:hypothetical protein
MFPGIPKPRVQKNFELNLKVKNFVLELLDDAFPLVTYYTVRWDGALENETDKFILKFSGSDDYKQYYNQLAALLADMGERKGARIHYFSRHENRASALPPKGTFKVNGIEIHFFENPLRLYCIRLSDQLVILFNDGIKSARTAQESKGLSRKFREAQVFARRIWDALQNKMILIDETSHLISNFDRTSDEILL